MVAQRQLVLVVEGNAALGAAWPLLRREYVDKITRAFAGYDNAGQKLQVPPGEMALIVFHNYGLHAECMMQQSGWTLDLDVFSGWLDALAFSGGGFGEAPIAEALAEALLLCCPGPVVTPPPQQGIERQKHVVLVSASGPRKLATPIARPPVLALAGNAAPTDGIEQWWLADAVTLGHAFAQCAVSLSIIAPRQIQALKEVYNKGKRNLRSAEPMADALKQYPQHLVLLSEGFLAARVALHRVTGAPPATRATDGALQGQVAVASQAPPLQLPPQPALLGSQMGGPLVGTLQADRFQSPPQVRPPGALPMGAVKKELGLGVPHMPQLQPISASSAGAPQIRPPREATGSPTPSMSSQGPALSNLSQQPIHLGQSGLGMMDLSHLGNQGVGVSGLKDAAVLADVGMGMGAAATANLGLYGMGQGAAMTQGSLGGLGQGNMGVPQQVGMAQGNLGMGQSMMRMGQPSGVALGQAGGVGMGLAQGAGGYGKAGPLPGVNQAALSQPSMASSRLGGSQGQGLGMGNMGTLSTMVPTPGMMPTPGMVSTSSMVPTPGMVQTSTMMPTPGVVPTPEAGQLGGHGMMANLGALSSQGLMATELGGLPGSSTGAPGMQQHVTQQQVPQQQAPGTGHNKFTMIWEGLLAGQRQGQPVALCKMQGYVQATSASKLADDWPPTMQIMRLINQDYMNSKEYQGKAELLIFKPLQQHGFLSQMAERKLCAVIQLPSHTLLLAAAPDRPGRMIGMLFPKDMVIFRPNSGGQPSSNQQAGGTVGGQGYKGVQQGYGQLHQQQSQQQQQQQQQQQSQQQQQQQQQHQFRQGQVMQGLGGLPNHGFS